MKKRLFSFLLAASMLLSCLALSAAAAEEANRTSFPKVLLIGNSYSVDVMTYLNQILLADDSIGDFTLGYLFYAGCTLKQHATFAKDNAPEYKYYKCESSAKTDWTAEVTLLSALQDEDWDLIYLQQAPLHSAQEKTYTSHLENLIAFVNENKTNPNAKLGWHMTWSYADGYATSNDYYSPSFVSEFQGSSLTMYHSIAAAVQNKVMSTGAFEAGMVPSGTVIQSARANYFGDIMNRDFYHLSELGRLITGYLWYAHLTGKPVEQVTLTNTPVSLTEMDRVVIKELVNNAIANPYTVTPSRYPNRLTPRAINLTNGTASIDGQLMSSAIKDAQITLTYSAPIKDMVFDHWNAVSGNVTFADAKSASTTFAMPNEDVTIEAVYTNTCPAQKMTDVNPYLWYHDAVDYVLTNGIMGGYSATSFGPNDSLSRAMVVQVLYNKEGKPAVTAENKFPDVPNDQWYCNAVRWAAGKGVVGGYGDGRFGPNDNVTIEQVAVILHNYAGKPAAEGNLSSVGKYDDWAAGALQWAVTNGVLKNVPFTNATDTATRAQTAQMLMNYMER